MIYNTLATVVFALTANSAIALEMPTELQVDLMEGNRTWSTADACFAADLIREEFYEKVTTVPRALYQTLIGTFGFEEVQEVSRRSDNYVLALHAMRDQAIAGEPQLLQFYCDQLGY